MQLDLSWLKKLLQTTQVLNDSSHLNMIMNTDENDYKKRYSKCLSPLYSGLIMCIIMRMTFFEYDLLNHVFKASV